MGILNELRKEYKKSLVRVPKGLDFKKEYELIKEKKSTLSASQRKAVILKVEGMQKTAVAEKE